VLERASKGPRIGEQPGSYVPIARIFGRRCASSTPHTAASARLSNNRRKMLEDSPALEGVLSPHSEDCPSNDHAVLSQRPMRNIVKIIGHPLLDFGARVGGASPAEHLS